MTLKKLIAGIIIGAPLLWLAVNAPIATLAIALVNYVIHKRMPKDRPFGGKLLCLLMANSMLCMFAAPMGAVYGTIAGITTGALCFSMATGMDWSDIGNWIEEQCGKRHYKGSVEIFDEKTGKWREYDTERHEWA